MKAPVLEYLVCPMCKSDLRLKRYAGENDWTEEGVLDCACGGRYPIIRGIPVLIEPGLRLDVLGDEEIQFWKKYPNDRPASAASPAHAELRTAKKSAAEVWGYQWQHFHQVWQEKAGEEQFYRWVQPLRPEDLQGKIILDAGCGTGRHVRYSALHAKTVIGIDLSFATRVAERLSHELPNAHVVQADIYRLPFHLETFDRIFSLGVLHHLPDPKGAYLGLLPYAKKGGSMTAWLYGRENNWFAAVGLEGVRSLITRRLPLPWLRALSLIPAILLRLIIQFIYVPLNAVAPSAAAKLPYNTFFMLFYRLSFRNLWIMVFDQLDAPIANYYRREVMEDWLRSSGLTSTCLTQTNDISWTIHGIRS